MMTKINFSEKEKNYLKTLNFWEMPVGKDYVKSSIRKKVFGEKCDSTVSEPSDWFYLDNPQGWIEKLRFVNKVYTSNYLSFKERNYMRRRIKSNTFLEGLGRPWMHRIERNVEDEEWETMVRNLKLVNGFEKNQNA